MNIFKLKIIKLLSLITIFALLLIQTGVIRNIFTPHTAYAVGDLNVDWNGVSEGNPIFSISDFAPGQMESHTVNIQNSASSTRPVGIRGILTENTGNISNVLYITISSGAENIYGEGSPTGAKTLAQFFDDTLLPDFINLGNINSGASKSYTIKVHFDEGAGNDYQNKQIVFDLKIGVAIETPEACSEIKFTSEPIFGTQKSDKITGTPGNDLIFGLEGSDKIEGGGGDDCIVGGEGSDSITGNNGDDVIFGNEKSDTLNGNNGMDLIFGGVDSDLIKGGNDADKLYGEAGSDKIEGENGHDILEGGTQSDSLDGGNGNDSLVGGDGIDKASGKGGTDTCDAESENTCEL